MPQRLVGTGGLTHHDGTLDGGDGHGGQFGGILADEMGLGKTVEAIATLAHLRAKGDNNFLVVCPAAVVIIAPGRCRRAC